MQNDNAGLGHRCGSRERNHQHQEQGHAYHYAASQQQDFAQQIRAHQIFPMHDSHLLHGHKMRRAQEVVCWITALSYFAVGSTVRTWQLYLIFRGTLSISGKSAVRAESCPYYPR